MFRKSAQISVWLIVLGLSITVLAGTTAAQPQSLASYHLFGITVEDIYDLGVMVTEVDLGSRARQIGLLRDDVILAVNGVPVLGTYEFQILAYEFGGGPLSLTISRIGQINTVIIDPSDNP